MILRAKPVSGVLTLIGDATKNQWGVWTFSVVEVGEHELRNVEASDLMATYMQAGLGKTVELLVGKGGGFTGKRILGVKYDGKARRDNPGAYVGAVIACGIFALVFLVGGLWPCGLAFAFFGAVAVSSVLALLSFR